jgi:hypothetical protein
MDFRAGPRVDKWQRNGLRFPLFTSEAARLVHSRPRFPFFPIGGYGVSPDTYRQIKSLFHETVDLPPLERETLLAGQASWLREEVERLLKETGTESEFLERPAVGWEFRMRTQLAAMRHTTSKSPRDAGTV